jgi:hypothetical protein
LLNERGHEVGHLSRFLVGAVFTFLRATNFFIALLGKLKECHQMGIPNSHWDQVFTSLNIHENRDAQIL